MDRNTSIPRMPGLPIIGSIRRMQTDTLAFLTEASQRGDIVFLGGLPSNPHFLVNNPDYIGAILQNKSGDFFMNRDHEVLRVLLNESVFTLKGKAWLKRRRLLQPVFHSSQLPKLASHMSAVLLDMISQWDNYARDGKTIDVATEMMDLALKFIVRAMFGVNLDEDKEQLEEYMNIGMQYRKERRWGILKVPMSWPTPQNRRFKAVLKSLDQIIYRIIEQHRNENQDPENLLARLIYARDVETNETLTDSQIRDEVMTMFTVGHVTTAAGMAWTHYFIMQHPEVECKLRDELKNVLGDRLPQYDDLDNLPYLDRVVRETLRLHPPSWLITRRTIKPTRLGDYIIPANSLLIMSQYTSHRHPDLWEDPLTFKPDRFALPYEDRQHKYSYYSFGDGPRHCIGNRIAILEIMISVSTLLQRFRLELEPDQVVEPVALSALKPRNGILARVVCV